MILNVDTKGKCKKAKTIKAYVFQQCIIHSAVIFWSLHFQILLNLYYPAKAKCPLGS